MQDGIKLLTNIRDSLIEGRIKRTDVTYTELKDIVEVNMISYLGMDEDEHRDIWDAWNRLRQDMEAIETDKEYIMFLDSIIFFMQSMTSVADKISNSVLTKEYWDYRHKNLQDNIEYTRFRDLTFANNLITEYDPTFANRYNDIHVEVHRDEDKDMLYVLHQDKKMYFPRTWDAGKIERYYISLLLEQDQDSPHCYEQEGYVVRDGDVVIDAGVAEGNFALERIDRVSKIYLIEPDPLWREPLQYTFEPYMDKVEFVYKFLGKEDNEMSCSIDGLCHDTVVNYIKMDIEGFEEAALEGGHEVFSRKDDIAVAICSYHKKASENFIHNMFSALGYEVTHSKGYMCIGGMFNILLDADLRRGVVFARNYEPKLEEIIQDDDMGNVKLSISVLISNNKDNVIRCLDSVKPLLQTVNSELILTDTGVDKELREILETYTDNIIDYTWNKDFSEARNLGLKKAKGEWFLYVDDDEWFEDTTAIANFINATETKNYNVACYTQRNYYDLSGEAYMDHYVDRILRINPKLHFEHRVHEAYTDIEIKDKILLDAYVHHYGYAYASDEDRCKKSKRNQELLELECAENPTDMRMRYQLVLNQYEQEDWLGAIEYAKSAIKQDSDSEYWDLLHTTIMYCYDKLQDWNSILSYGREFLDKQIYPYEQFAIRQFMIHAYSELAVKSIDIELKNQYYSEVCQLMNVCIELFNKHCEDDRYFNRNQLMHTTFIETDRVVRMIMESLVAAMVMKNDEFIDGICNSVLGETVNEILANENLTTWMNERVEQYEAAEQGIVSDDVDDENQVALSDEKISTDIDRLVFEKNFFDRETRMGFTIEPMVKHAWAANLEVLHIIDRICRENDIQYFADWGTLLGAVRHNGYIPWDDDIDIGMMRRDINKFYEAIKKYDDISILNNYTTDDWGRSADKVVCNVTYSLDREMLKRHYGFPFTAGVDIFVIDYVNRDKSIETEQIDVLRIISELNAIRNDRDAGIYSGTELTEANEREKYLVKELSRLTSIEFDDELPPTRELNILWEEVSGMCRAEDADYVSEMACLGNGQDYYIPKEYYEEFINVPFENTTIPIPKAYDYILQVKYGEDYMTPQNIEAGHGYPFYGVAAETVASMKGITKEQVLQNADEIALGYYDRYLNEGDEPTIKIDDSYFQEEVIDGQVVSTEQKQIWAALLETYTEVRRVCDDANIQLFAIGETLIGAEYLQGILPESTDIHLAIKREDYVSFMDSLQKKLSSWFNYSCLYTDEEHEDLRIYVTSDSYLRDEVEFKNRFHGCPYEVGVDIAIIDNLSDDNNREDSRLEMVSNLLATANAMPAAGPYSQEVQQIAEQWKANTGLDINTRGNLRNAFVKAADTYAGAYREKANICRITAELQEDMDILYKTEWFDEVVDIPFGPTTIGVPSGYQEILG